MTAPDPIAYLDAAAATTAGQAYKRRFVDALDVLPGHTVVDIGCGPGTDLAALADATGTDGSVIGVDRDPRMLDEARRRLADRPNVVVCPGDAADLPLASGSADRARVDRVLQHVPDPTTSITEIRRVLRPGGLCGMAEPDWHTLAVADEDHETSSGFAEFVAGQVRNATVGRQLVRLCVDAGLRVRSVEPIAVLFRDFGTADQILGLRRNCARAIQAGRLAEARADAWLRRVARGPVVAGFTFYLVTAEK
ncbi:methyltransferase domain-containing protein [Micromonospora sp. CPCC 206061]|uniref:methyltransferase domain-containing protein n=1 Tax=Micromonospora sp. CPCC 206061 TaxID=3122410 RepID=UPI002FF1C162